MTLNYTSNRATKHDFCSSCNCWILGSRSWNQHSPWNQWLFALCGWMLCAVLRGLPLRKHFLLEWPIYVLFDGEVYPFGGSNNSKQSVTCIDKINCPQRINKTWTVPTTNIQASITCLTQITYIGIGLYNVKHLTFNKYAIEHNDTTYPLLVACGVL